MPSPRSLPTRELYFHSDPDAVSAWARAHATPGTVYVAPSAAARRLALQHVADTRATTLGITIDSRGRVLPLLESRAGLATPRIVSGPLEHILVTESARAARVPLFDDANHDAPAGAVAAVARLIRTLRLNRVTPDQLEAAGGDARAADAYRRFERRRRELGFHDETDRIDALLAVGVPSLPLVFEDPSFSNRAHWELHRAAIQSSSSCHIGAAILGDDGTTSPAWTARLDVLAFTRTVEQQAPRTPATRAVGGVGMYDEVDLVSREMLALLRTNPALRPSVLLGVAPNRAYLSILGEACVRVGIPVASPRALYAMDVPLVRALLDTFRLLVDPTEDTVERGLALLATPYVGLKLGAHDRLSRNLERRGLGALRSWRRFAGSTGNSRFVKLAGSVARLAERMQGECAPKELAATLTSLGLDFGFLSSGRRFNLDAGRDDALRVDQKGWEVLAAAADELNEALRIPGTTRISARRWLAQLTDAIADSTVRVDAKAYDGVHLTIAGAGLPSAAHVFAVGWREGVFPRRTREDPLLPERVARALNEQGAMIPLAPDRTSREQERRERIRRAARESLVISWPATGEDGEALLPSFYMDDLGVTARAPRSVGDTTWPLPLAASRHERLTRATIVARHRPTDRAGSELAAVRDALASLSPDERRAYEGRLHAGQVIQLPTEILAEAGVLAGRMSATQAKSVVHCLYEHFGRKRLRLGALAVPQLDELRLGEISHGVLNELGRLGFEPEALDEVFERWWRRVVPPELLGEAQSAFERELSYGNLRALVEREHAHFAVSPSRPAYFELGFGMQDEGRDPASRDEGLDIRLPLGASVAVSTLRGSIDRVDVVERGRRRYGVAIDYKSGRGEFNAKEMEERADFQLPIYCEALPLFGIEPVGAVYYGILSGERHGVIRDDFADDFIPAGSTGKVTAFAPERFAAYMGDRQQELRAQIARVSRGELVTRPRNDDCGFCDLRPVCRIGTFGVGGAPEDLL
jgi:hypothetical protein